MIYSNPSITLPDAQGISANHVEASSPSEYLSVSRPSQKQKRSVSPGTATSKKSDSIRASSTESSCSRMGISKSRQDRFQPPSRIRK